MVMRHPHYGCENWVKNQFDLQDNRLGSFSNDLIRNIFSKASLVTKQIPWGMLILAFVVSFVSLITSEIPVILIWTISEGFI